MHQAWVKLPAVSGSSGKLVIDPPKIDATESGYPGAVFANPDLDYVQAMTQFVAASEKETQSPKQPKRGAETESQSCRLQKQQLRHEEETLRGKRRGVRERREREGVALFTHPLPGKRDYIDHNFHTGSHHQLPHRNICARLARDNCPRGRKRPSDQADDACSERNPQSPSDPPKLKQRSCYRVAAQ
jgi:hypothetical protein